MKARKAAAAELAALLATNMHAKAQVSPEGVDVLSRAVEVRAKRQAERDRSMPTVLAAGASITASLAQARAILAASTRKEGIAAPTAHLSATTSAGRERS